MMVKLHLHKNLQLDHHNIAPIYYNREDNLILQYENQYFPSNPRKHKKIDMLACNQFSHRITIEKYVVDL